MTTHRHWHLAQINIAKLRAPLDDPLLAEFSANLDIVNRAAEISEGFIWRFTEDAGDVSDFTYFGPDYIVNMSVWQDIRSLRRYIASEPHLSVMMKKQNWFHVIDGPHLALWWIQAGTVPTLVEADERLNILQAKGPTQSAFTFQDNFSPPASDA